MTLPRDPWTALAVALIRRAWRDARGGDLDALAWLGTVGADYAEAIAPGAGDTVTTCAAGCCQALDDAQRVVLRRFVLRRIDAAGG